MPEMQPMPPPLGGDHSRGPDVYGAIIPISILSTAFVLIRMYVRIKVVHIVGWDDHTIVLAQFMNLFNFIVQILAVQNGLGRHMYYLPLQNIVNVGLYFHIVEVLYVSTNAVNKISACLFLLRILDRSITKTLRRFLYILMGILLVCCIATAVIILIQCRPIQAGWDPRIKGKCWSYSNILGIGYAQSAWAIVSDITCAGFPFIVIRKLKIDRRNRYALWFIMCVGLLSAFCCIIKLVYLGDLAKGDFTYNAVNTNNWSVLESNIGTIACCIPALRPLFKFLRERSALRSNSKVTLRSNSRVGENTTLAGSRKSSMANRLSSIYHTFYSSKNDVKSGGEQQTSPAEEEKRIRETTLVEQFHFKVGDDQQAKGDPIEMV